jgi:hypothetical protein
VVVDALERGDLVPRRGHPRAALPPTRYAAFPARLAPILTPRAQTSRPFPSSCMHSFPLARAPCSRPASLSWADTAASTFGRLWGRRTRPLPARVPLLRLPLAPRKSLAGFAAASATGALAAMLFWRVAAPLRPAAPGEVSWSFDGGFAMRTDDVVGRALRDAGLTGFKAGGWLGLGLIGLTAGVVSGIAEALGGPRALSSLCECVLICVCRCRDVGRQPDATGDLWRMPVGVLQAHVVRGVMGATS